MIRLIGLIISTSLFLGCNRGENVGKKPLNNKDRVVIEEFAHSLVHSFNNNDYTLIRNYWDNEAFKERIDNLTKAQMSVFIHFFDKVFKQKIVVANVSFINRINTGNGKALISAIKHFEFHTEVSIRITISDNFNYVKYRVELKNERPYLCDFYDFKEGIWYSQNIKNLINLNSKFKAGSSQRTQANNALKHSEDILSQGDTLSALLYLGEIPETHWMGNGLSIKKLNLASSLGDSIYASTLASEFRYNKSIYMEYLHSLYFQDSVKLKNVLNSLSKQTGDTLVLDSLAVNQYFWN